MEGLTYIQGKKVCPSGAPVGRVYQGLVFDARCWESEGTAIKTTLIWSFGKGIQEPCLGPGLPLLLGSPRAAAASVKEEREVCWGLHSILPSGAVEKPPGHGYVLHLTPPYSVSPPFL